jgi:hypothetical protein
MTADIMPESIRLFFYKQYIVIRRFPVISGALSCIILCLTHRFIEKYLSFSIHLQLCNELDADNISRTFKTTKQHDMAATKFEGMSTRRHFYAKSNLYKR